MGIFQQFPYTNFHEMNMDEILKIVKTLAEEWAAYQVKWGNLYDDTEQALNDFKEYVYNYFDDLDVQAEINKKIDEMVLDGTFQMLVRTQLSPVVTDWLQDNITVPVGVVIDTSLSIAGACADAKAAGDAIRLLAAENDFITGSRAIVMNEGAYVNTKVAPGSAVDLTPVSSASHAYAIVPCSEGDKFYINARGTNVGVPYAFVDSADNLIDRAMETTKGSSFVVAPANATNLVINNYLDGIERYSYTGEFIGYVEPITFTTIDGYYINGNDGSTSTASARSCSSFIEIEPDRDYFASFIYLDGNASISEYDAQHKFLRYKSMTNNNNSVHVHTGSDAKYIRLSGYRNYQMEFNKYNTIKSNAEDVDDLIEGRTEYTATGNPLHINDTSSDSMLVSITGSDANTIITRSNKNLIWFDDHTVTRNGVTFTYTRATGEINISSTGATANTTSGNSGNLNGNTVDFDVKIRPKTSRTLTLSVNPSEFLDYDSDVYMQFFSSIVGIEAVRNRFARVCSAQTEYAVRIVVRAGWSGNITLKPQLEFGAIATEFEPNHRQRVSVANIRNITALDGVTNVYTDDDSTLTVTLKKQNEQDKLPDTNEVAAAVKDLMPLVKHPYAKMNATDPMICFIDDDTTDLSLVQRYHSLFNGLDAVGNYAVMTYRLDTESGLADQLLDYEKEGFGMLYHIDYQMGASTEYFLPDPLKRDMALAEDNFVTGLRKMQQYGFSNYKFWVSPYGVNDPDMQALAKRHGMRCLMSTGNNSSINKTNAYRWNIPRYGFDPLNDNTQFLREALAITKSNNGMMVVTTHVNAWGNDYTIDSRFQTFVNHCISEGVKVVSFGEAFETYYPMFLLNELF